MHESGLIADLIEKIEALARENSARRVVAVDVSVGALAGIGAEHLKEHFPAETAGTMVEGAELRVKVLDDPMADSSYSLLLESVELEQ